MFSDGSKEAHIYTNKFTVNIDKISIRYFRLCGKMVYLVTNNSKVWSSILWLTVLGTKANNTIFWIWQMTQRKVNEETLRNATFLCSTL